MNLLKKNRKMKAERKETESDLAIDVFFTNSIRGKDGDTPYIRNGNWWIGDKDTGVLARGVDGKTPAVGANGNWWVGGVDTGIRGRAYVMSVGANGNWLSDGQDLGVKATAPVVTIGANGNWFVDGRDTFRPSLSPSCLNKDTDGVQTVNGGIVVKGPMDVRKRAYVASNPNTPANSNNQAYMYVGPDDPRYIIVHDRIIGGKAVVVISTPPDAGEMYVITCLDNAGMDVASSDSSVKFWEGNHDAVDYYTKAIKGTLILHGIGRAWFVSDIKS